MGFQSWRRHILNLQLLTFQCPHSPPLPLRAQPHLGEGGAVCIYSVFGEGMREGACLREKGRQTELLRGQQTSPAMRISFGEEARNQRDSSGSPITIQKAHFALGASQSGKDPRGGDRGSQRTTATSQQMLPHLCRMGSRVGGRVGLEPGGLGGHF